MATVTGFTAERMKEIEDSTIVDGDVIGDNLILVTRNGQQINAGSVRGAPGPVGPAGQVSEAPTDSVVYARRNGVWIPVPNAPLRDTKANLAANNPVVAVGRLAIATDAVPQMFAIGDGVTAWNGLPKYVHRQNGVFSETTTAFTIAGGDDSIKDRTGLNSVTFTVGDVPWIVTYNEPVLRSTTQHNLIELYIRSEANSIRNVGQTVASSQLSGGYHWGYGGTISEIISAPGTYTRKASVRNGVGGEITFTNAGARAQLIARPL